MKNILVLFLLFTSFGCNAYKQMTGGEDNKGAYQATAPQEPDFNPPFIVGYSREKYFGKFENDMTFLKPCGESIVSLWIYDEGHWYKIRPHEPPTSYFIFDGETGTLMIFNTKHNLYYCVYHYIKQ